MKIKETKTHFIAITTEKYEKESYYPAGQEVGRISKKTGRFTGATLFMIELHEAFDKFQEAIDQEKEALIDKVIAEMKRDIESGDVSAIFELLTRVDDQYLIAYLPEGK